jgi:hypothetical protein
VVEWRWVVLVREETGARKIHLAASGERRGVLDSGPAVHVTGGNRLAAPGAQLRSANRGVSQRFLFFSVDC